MPIIRKAAGTAARLLFGDTLIPQEFTVGLPDPQTEIAVRLHGIGAPLDVTNRHSTACCAPLTICVSLDKGQESPEPRRPVSLRFCERVAPNHLLGEIRLQLSRVLTFDSVQLVLFDVVGSTNYCLPRARLWAHYSLQAYNSWRRGSPIAVERMTLLEQRAAMVTFIRPHPLSLVSVVGESGGNIFPMNLMGDLGHGYFAFALTVARLAGRLVQRAGRLAVSTVPLPQSAFAFDLIRNHRKESIDWDQLPFQLKTSPALHIPIPVFAARVRELQVEKSLEMGGNTGRGSHTFFVARILSDQRFSEDLTVNVIHGFYQCWRAGHQKADLQASVTQDALNKRRLNPA